ncbi:MAG: hypothetical protein JWN34_6043 [Bryobacterales bacterium]|nr:hypothetical protein [Bryobacterales bacterium]
MASLIFDQKKVPFLLTGSGQATVDVGLLDPNLPLNPNTPAIFKAGFSATGAQKVQLGTAQSVKLGLSASASLSITTLLPRDAGSPQLVDAGLEDFFAKGGNAEKLILVFDTAAKLDGSAGGSFVFAPLTAAGSVEAGAGGGYTYLRAFDQTRILSSILDEFFSSIRFPEHGDAAPAPGESITLRYGGYLKLGAEASAGFRLSGSKSLSLGDMALSEKYDLSILGKIGLTAGVAGHFSIRVSADAALPGWARVCVHRHRASSLAVAADVKVGFNNNLTGLPANPREFLGAVLGVNAKSFLNVFGKAVELSDPVNFEKALDGLAKKYIEEFTGKPIAQLKGTNFEDLLGMASNAVNSHTMLGDRAVTLFDRFFDRLDVLQPFLEKLSKLDDKGFVTLRADLTDERGHIFSQLTDGDPLGFLLDEIVIKSVRIDARAELNKRAEAVLALIENKDGDHKELRRAVELAKKSFGIDGFLSELSRVHTPENLKAAANQKLGMFVTRLLGELDSSDNFRKSFEKVHAVLGKIDGFGANLFKAFSDAASSSWKVALHAEYSRASETDALIDVAINMTSAEGRALMQSAGKGDFLEIVSHTDTDIVRLSEGVFTHKTRRESAFRVSISGWHLNYKYEGFDRVITSSEQRLVPSDQGIRIDSTVALETEKERKRRDESTHINFLLRALGESRGVVQAPSTNTAFLIDTLSSLTARYQIEFEDGATTASELNDYLAFARDLGFQNQGATLADLDAFLPKTANGGFGKVTVSYDVRFGRAALNALLSQSELSAHHEGEIRNTMRRNLRMNYLKGNSQQDVAIAYSTPAVYRTFLAEPVTFVNQSGREVQTPNGRISLSPTDLRHIQTLFGIEDKMIGAIRSLYEFMSSGQQINPRDFEKKLGKFGSAMKAYDDFDQTETKNGVGANSIFIMFDTLVRLAAGGPSAHAATLTLTSEVNGTSVEKIFLSDAATESAAAVATTGS